MKVTNDRDVLGLVEGRLFGGLVGLESTGAVFGEGLGFEGWLGVGRRLGVVSGCVWWWIGDWLNWGEGCVAVDCREHRNGVGVCVRRFGERYRAGLELFDFDYGSLRKMAWVCRRVGRERRRVGLSFAHHAEVAHMEDGEQVGFLDEALRNGWSRSELRVAIRRARATELEAGSGRVGFVPHVWELEGIGWYEEQIEADPPQERKEALARQLRALIWKLQRLEARLRVF